MYFQFGNLFTDLGSADGKAKPSEPEVKGVNLYDPDNRTTISQMSLDVNMESQTGAAGQTPGADSPDSQVPGAVSPDKTSPTAHVDSSHGDENN